MDVGSLKDYLVRHKEELITSIERGKYRPNPVRRIESQREREASRVGYPYCSRQGYPTEYSATAYPALMNPGSLRGVLASGQSGALTRHLVNAGTTSLKAMCMRLTYHLERFFDTVSHSKLTEVLSHKVKDGRVISLIHKYLNAGVMNEGKYEETTEGVPQGGPLSPVLSNILLNELDKELERRGHKYVRYADDMVIFCRSRRSAERTMQSIIPFIEGKLFLKVNRDKSQVAHVRGIKFLGYSFYIVKGEGRLRIHPKSVAKMKARIKELTSRSNGWGNDRRKEALSQYIKGWVQYFKLADMKILLIRVDEWYRRRLRMVIWKQWKRIKTKVTNLVKLGINKLKAYEWANTRKSYWHTAGSFILTRTITTKRLRLAGYAFLLDQFNKVKVVS